MSVANWARRSGVVLSLVAASSVVLATGCKKKKRQDAASATTSGETAAAKSEGPCAEYASKVCDKAGAESPSCEAFKVSTELMPAKACSAGLKDLDHVVKKLADMRQACEGLVERLCKDVGPETQTCNMVKTQTKEFPPERCAMMSQRYDEVLADLKRMEAANQPLSPEQQAALVQGDVPSFGPADAKVTVVEFSDFECPYCSKAAEVVQQIKQKYGNEVRFVFRQFPLNFHQNARTAAEASLAAHAQGKFWAFHDKMFENQRQLDRASLEQYASSAGLDMAKFKQALDEGKYGAQVDADMKLGEQVTVQGTPTLFVNGARVANPTDFAAVDALIGSALKG